MIRIKHLTEEGPEMEIIRGLFRDYEMELGEDLCFQSFEEELREPLKKYGPPNGDLLLAYWDEEAVGCIALTPMKDRNACEMKRLYVIPTFRNKKIGRILIDELLLSAQEKGYLRMRLDTFSKLKPALSLYKEYGFKNITPYYANPNEGVIYMEKHLRDSL